MDAVVDGDTDQVTAVLADPVTVAAKDSGVSTMAPGSSGEMVTATGTGATGVNAMEGEEAGPVPAPLIAATVNEYAVPFVRPVTDAVVPVTRTLPAAGEMTTT